MNKKSNKKKSLFWWLLSSFAVLVILLEGFLYYNPTAYPQPLFRWMFIIQNGIKAFGFRSDVGLREMSKIIASSTSLYETVVGYAYTLVIFIAPLCTAVAVYTVIKNVFPIKSVKWLFINERNIVVFGYNDAVKRLVSTREAKQRIHIVDATLSQAEEINLLKNGIAVHKEDCLNLKGKQLAKFASRIKLRNTTEIILFDESSAKNFSVYQMFHKEELKEISQKGLKFFCRCEDEGMKRIMEDYHDEKRLEAKDLEFISIPELRIKAMLEKHPLHTYHSSVYMEKEKWNTEEYKTWNLHLLIVGFGRLGQQLLLQAMNMGVVSSENDILIDVVDYDMQNKKSFFATHFNDNYVKFDDAKNEIEITSEKADGTFKIRFHNMDIRYQQFTTLLNEIGAPGADGKGLFNYIAVCIRDMDLTLGCMAEIEKYLNRYKDVIKEREVSVGVRLEANRQMAEYVRRNNGTFRNVFVIDDPEKVLSLKTLINDELAKDAKIFNYIYSTLSFDKPDSPKPEDAAKPLTVLVEEVWHCKEMYKRNSNRAIAQHDAVKQMLMVKEVKDKLEAYFGENGELLQDQGNYWTFIERDENKLIDKLNDAKEYPWVSEFVKLEHRRWCYFMASCGWQSVDNFYQDRDVAQKANACMCNWNELSQKGEKQGKKEPKSYTCKYDLMPLLKTYLDTKAK